MATNTQIVSHFPARLFCQTGGGKSGGNGGPVDGNGENRAGGGYWGWVEKIPG